VRPFFCNLLKRHRLYGLPCTKAGSDLFGTTVNFRLYETLYG
jgi:hypothetical protein